MQIHTIALAAALAFAGAANAQHEHGAPRHGGVAVETKALDFEVVAKADRIQVYVGEHGKAVKLAGAKGKVTLLTGSEKSEAELAPVGDDYLEARGSFKVGKGTKGIAVVTLAGKPAATARFELK